MLQDRGVANFKFIFLSHFSTKFERFGTYPAAFELNFPKNTNFFPFWWISEELWQVFLDHPFFLVHPVYNMNRSLSITFTGFLALQAPNQGITNTHGKSSYIIGTKATNICSAVALLYQVSTYWHPLNVCWRTKIISTKKWQHKITFNPIKSIFKWVILREDQ